MLCDLYIRIYLLCVSSITPVAHWHCVNYPNQNTYSVRQCHIFFNYVLSHIFPTLVHRSASNT